MLFETFVDAEAMLLWGGFLIALVLGAVVNKTNFCTMGAVSDLVNIGDTGRLRAWLFAIMHNRRVDIARGERFFAPEVGGDADRQAQADDAPTGDAIDPLDLQRAYAGLSPEHREVLLFVAVEQLSYADAAAAMGVPIGTVMSRLSRARARLREALGAPGESAKEPNGDERTPRLTRIK